MQDVANNNQRTVSHNKKGMGKWTIVPKMSMHI